jgi:ATP-dependent Clp endopeptidase proteolytic subunit ClpP
MFVASNDLDINDKAVLDKEDSKVKENYADVSPSIASNNVASPSQKYTESQVVWGMLYWDSPQIITDGVSLHFEGEITKDSVTSLKSTIIDMTKEAFVHYHRIGVYNPSDMRLTLHINSPGGCMASGYSLIDFMQRNPIPINTVGTGTVASMGLIILIAGKRRYITPNTNILAHQLRAGIGGKRQDMLDYIKHIENIHKQTVNFISKHTKLSISNVDDMLKRESWLTAEEAIKFGFADEILA